MFIGNPVFGFVAICLHFAWVDGITKKISTQGSSELGANGVLFHCALCKGGQTFQRLRPLLLLIFFYLSSSDASSNDVDSSDFSSDENSPTQQPQTLTGAARKGSFLLRTVFKKKKTCLISDDCGIAFMCRVWTMCGRDILSPYRIITFKIAWHSCKISAVELRTLLIKSTKYFFSWFLPLQ